MGQNQIKEEEEILSNENKIIYEKIKNKYQHRYTEKEVFFL
jgi:hypothetical protein